MVLDYLYEIKTSRRNSTLDSQRFSIEEVDKIFDPIKKNKTSLLSKKDSVKPIEMESVHIDIEKKEGKKGILNFFKKK
ncbi:MAG: hypothetical protein PQJ45_11955 [Sphaerochaetaceae bacterium]|jgi:hypothetical protein|nr:hypothetical protein [Sphaerochaetaceae bacterium]MDC7238472.1 hypothetical protein [Sphaerochaetaceae bacterium]MDC7242775.1 hypothetical protein [Sphaerochaetaceae bacterium]